jgi:hypothetical protein
LLLEVVACRDTDGQRLVGQVSDSRQRATLLVEGELRILVRDGVDVERDIPAFVANSDSGVRNGLRLHQRIESEEVLGIRSANIIGIEGV